MIRVKSNLDFVRFGRSFNQTPSYGRLGFLRWKVIACTFLLWSCGAPEIPTQRIDFDPSGKVPSLRVLRWEMPDGNLVGRGDRGSYRFEFEVGDRLRTKMPAVLIKSAQDGFELVFIDDLNLAPKNHQVVENVPPGRLVKIAGIKADQSPIHFAVFLLLEGRSEWVRCRSFCRSKSFDDPGRMVVSTLRFQRQSH